MIATSPHPPQGALNIKSSQSGTLWRKGTVLLSPRLTVATRLPAFFPQSPCSLQGQAIVELAAHGKMQILESGRTKEILLTQSWTTSGIGFFNEASVRLLL